MKGLPMQVHARWWPEYKHEGTKPYLCEVIGPKPKDKTYSTFVFDSKSWGEYDMKYRDVLRYADKNHEKYSNYYLPSQNKLPPLKKVSVYLKFLFKLVFVSELTKDALCGGRWT